MSNSFDDDDFDFDIDDFDNNDLTGEDLDHLASNLDIDALHDEEEERVAALALLSDEAIDRVLQASADGLELERSHAVAVAEEGMDLKAAAAEAVRAAAAEGLTLERSDLSSGFKGVKRNRHRFRAEISHGSAGRTDFGTFDTAEEAALAYARAREPRLKPATPTAAEVLQQAVAEGLELERSDNKTGFKGVFPSKHRFAARIRADGREKVIGSFDTIEEAALAYARARSQQEKTRAAAAAAVLEKVRAAAKGAPDPPSTAGKRGTLDVELLGNPAPKKSRKGGKRSRKNKKGKSKTKKRHKKRKSKTRRK